MAGINVFACRIALIQALRDAGIAEEIDYSYAGPNADGSREYIYGGDRSGGVTDLATFAGQPGRIRRREDATWTLTIEVVIPGERTHEASDKRVCEIGAEFENWLSANWSIEAVPGLLAATVTGWTLLGSNDDEAARSKLTYAIEFQSFLE